MKTPTNENMDVRGEIIKWRVTAITHKITKEYKTYSPDLVVKKPGST